MLTAGIDIGSISTKAAVLADGKLLGSRVIFTGYNSEAAGKRVFEELLGELGMEAPAVRRIVSTGYGRNSVKFVDKAVTEIICHGTGAHFLNPLIRTVIDIGGQDSKAIVLDENGKVKNFAMNDKCAAGTGRGMEVFADLLQVPITQIGELSLQVEKEPPPVSSTCVVFAKSEASSLLREGWPKEKVIAAYCSAMAHRVVTLLERIGVEEDFAITGGIAKNVGVVGRIEKELGITALKPKIDTQIAGAVGAALFGDALVKKERQKG